jgi:hypothetical protein
MYIHRNKPAYDSTALSHDVDPNDSNIMNWWTASHDAAIGQMIKRYQWCWYWHIRDEIISITPKDILEKWKHSDPACEKRVWYNVLMYFAAARGEMLGLTQRIRVPAVKLCQMCGLQFREDSLPLSLIERLGIDQLDFCAPCLSRVLFNEGAHDSSTDEVEGYIRDLTETLNRIPPSDFGRNVEDFRGMTTNERLMLFQVLLRKPSLKRIKSLYGSWLKALVASGILEEDVRRTTRGIQCIANDGHVCNSLGEKTIDDLLNALGIDHVKEPRYPKGNYRADFRIGDVFIEYFGLAGDLEYDAKSILKMDICAAHNIDLLAIYPSDLSSVNSLKAMILKKIGQSD